ncbi:MAG: IS1634 family transposase [Clostridiales bacterium]|jgi:transposase|nr:IS1634 family transposase [Clostridiales bacterium]
MYISEGVNGNYCYACESVWDKELKKYSTPGKCIGRLDPDNSLIPNKFLSQLFYLEETGHSSLSDYEMLIIETAVEKYGKDIRGRAAKRVPKQLSEEDINTATAIFIGPEMVFGAITKRYRIDTLLRKSFNEKIMKDILSLAWYVASEGSALSDSDSWLDYYENPRGSAMSSQDVSRLLDIIDYDGMMTFYKLWLKEATKYSAKTDKALYDLTSISYYGSGIEAAEYGYNRDHENLPQVNYALLCMRSTAMPLFAWPMNGSISDIATLETTLQFLKKLQFMPDCLMMDRGFSSLDKLTGMFKNGYTFLQALKVNAKWIYGIIDVSESLRFNPNSKIDIGGRTYYGSTSVCRWVRIRNTSGKSPEKEDVIVHICGSARDKYISTEENIEVIAQYPCRVHVLFCQDLVGSQHDRFMDRLKAEYNRLVANENAKLQKEFEKYIKVYRKKYARSRTVEYDTDMIAQHKNKYAGYICFLTNDKTIETAQDALAEYSTRDYIEKDFDDMKNYLDMNRIRVWTDYRMRSRLFIQFIAEIYMREIRVCIRNSESCKKLTRKQVFAHIKTIYKVKFKGKYRDIYPELSKHQRDILEILNVNPRG